MSKLKGKKILITGASSGIGRALAVEAAKQGAFLALTGRNSEELAITQNLCKAYTDKVFTHVFDVAVESNCREFVTLAAEELGGIDVLVNNAGISMRANFSQTDLTVLKKVMDVNFWGTVYCTRYALSHLLKSKGSVVGISSIAGFKGLPGRTGYSASKFAMHGFLESLRVENLSNNLHVLIACPGFTASNIRNSALNELGKNQGESPREEQKMMQPDEVAKAVWNAVIARKSYLILTFNGKLTVWLNKFFTLWMDKLVYKHMKKEPGAPF
jgi:short-subunit dehydrogenase